MDLGARPVKSVFVITLPIIFPAVLSGWLLAFTLSWDDLVISSFTSGPGSSTLPMVVFSKVRLGVSPEINVLATLTLLVVSAMIVGASLWLGGRSKLERARGQTRRRTSVAPLRPCHQFTNFVCALPSAAKFFVAR